MKDQESNPFTSLKLSGCGKFCGATKVRAQSANVVGTRSLNGGQNQVQMSLFLQFALAPSFASINLSITALDDIVWSGMWVACTKSMH